MTILWMLVGVVAVCLGVAVLALGIARLSKASPLAPTTPVIRQDESNKKKGTEGEIAVTQRLVNELPAEYQVFVNVHVPRSNGSRTTELDQVVVSRFGVFVVETKAWSGLISRTKDPKIWKQQVGRAINDHDNPIGQNDWQIETLARHLGLRTNYLHGLVCFSKPDTRFGTKMPSNVVHLDQLPESILAHRTVVFDAEGVIRISEAIRPLT